MKTFQKNSPKTTIYWIPNILIGPTTTATNGRPNPRHVQDTNGASVFYKAVNTHTPSSNLSRQIFGFALLCSCPQIESRTPPRLDPRLKLATTKQK